MDVRRVKFGCLTPILCAMRASRFAPLAAISASLGATVVAVVTSSADDWERPLIVVLVGALALIADRYVIRSPTGTIVVATHPVFVLGMVTSGRCRC